MASRKQYSSSAIPNNQPVLMAFILLQLDNQKLTKEVQDLKQIIQSPMLIISNYKMNKILRNNKTSTYLLKRQITQIDWRLRQKFDQKINQLEQIQLNQRSDLESRRVQNPSFSYQNQKKDVGIVKNMDIRQTSAIDSRDNDIMKQKEEFKIYLKSNAHRIKTLLKKKDFNLTQKFQRLHTQDILRYEKQDLISKQQQEDKKQFIRIYDLEKPVEYDIEDL